jgi:hypothetical protein
MTAPLLMVKGLHARYGSIRVLHGIGFDVHPSFLRKRKARGNRRLRWTKSFMCCADCALSRVSLCF